MAIARNAADSAWTNTDSSATTSETYTAGSGSNRLLVIANASQSGTQSAVDFNSVAGTLDAVKYDPGGAEGSTNFTYVSHLVAPDSGAHTASATKSNAIGFYYIGCADYTGCKQTGQPDATATGSGSGITDLSYTITTVADDCWVATTAYGTAGGVASGTNCTFLINNGSVGFADSNAAVGAAGAKTVQFTGTSGRLFAASISFAPSVAAATGAKNMLLMGVG